MLPTPLQCCKGDVRRLQPAFVLTAQAPVQPAMTSLDRMLPAPRSPIMPLPAISSPLPCNHHPDFESMKARLHCPPPLPLLCFLLSTDVGMCSAP